MSEHEDHGAVAVHPVMLLVSSAAFLVLMALGYGLWAGAGQHTAPTHEQQKNSAH